MCTIAPPLPSAADLDDDDICPICEDECNCGSSRTAAPASPGAGATAGHADHNAHDDTPMPLFSQIVNQHGAPTPRKPRKQAARTAPDKSLLSRLVAAMGSRPQSAAHDDAEGEEVLDDGALLAFAAANAPISSSDDDDDAFVSPAAEINNHAASAALAQAMQIARSRNNAINGDDGDDNNDDDDEFINITDVTSDEGAAEFASETEFDLRPAARSTSALAQHAEWSDSRILDDGEDEDIEREDAAYLLSMRQSGYSSSSSLSELDDNRMDVIRSGGNSDSDLDSGAESDSESCGEDIAAARRRARGRRGRGQGRGRRTHRSSAWIDGTVAAAASSDSEDETDQELTFRAAQTEKEHALVEYYESHGSGEDALLEMHLDQLRAVRNVIQDYPGAPLGHAGALESDGSSGAERDIVFTYHPQGSDDSDVLSDDLVEGWAVGTHSRWGAAAASDGASGDSSMSESRADRLRREDGNGDSDHGSLYSSDSYDEFYTSSAFPDMGSEDYGAIVSGEVGGLYSTDLDLDGASLALGVALSMEQQGYSKEDAAAAAASVAAYPGRGAAGEAADEYLPTTTITASMNANGEADPIDGIVSVKSSVGRSGPSRMTTGTHTPFVSSDWRMAAAAVAAAYLDGPASPTMSYVLPRDLNEARSPGMVLATAAVASSDSSTADPSAASSATMAPSSLPSNDKRGGGSAKTAAEPPRPARTQSASLASAFTSQLPNSSFYKPLSSICSSGRNASVDATAAVQAASAASAPTTAALSVGGTPLVSLAEVNAALAAFAGCRSPGSPPEAPVHARTAAPKRKASCSEFQAASGDYDGTDDKRARRESQPQPYPPPSLALSAFFDLDNAQHGSSTLVMGAGTPMRGGFDARRSGGIGSDDEDGNDWLLTMDQLVDTDALLVQSPPPSPAEGAGSASDISSGLPFASGGRRSSTVAGGADMFARWDRIPVNIFRRSRALASSNRHNLSPHDDALGATSSLAMTAIKSSRQRRALVNSTLLTQHTLSAEAALRQHELKLALRGEHRGARYREPSFSAATNTGGRYHPPPPPPPSTPLSARVRMAPLGMTGRAGAAASTSPHMLHRSSSQDAAPSVLRAKALDLSPYRRGPGRPSSALRRKRADHLRTRHRKLVTSGIVTDVGTPCDSPGPESDSSETAGAAAGGALGDGDEPLVSNPAGDASDTGYAFDWLEDDEDLSLFAMPDIGTGDAVQQPSMTMLLASSSPMLMPLRTGGDAGPEQQR
ncbi:hypothetical protein LPJ61_003429 [Coemansia biformis]|uniref:Uncharacterized protein n=1 Tax=Coemansia biformis TaxID=1286918 RepID=A0A9W8CWA0_9FUNG|nr:hypothetical protein LPJ61_003429 [Coemansia biformis]